MVEITALSVRENVRLIPGATQYWRDVPRGAGLEAWYAAQVRGRTLLVGRPTESLLRSVNEVAESLHVVVRGIPDASDIAAVAPTAEIVAGFYGELADAPFDTVLALADVADLLPLETPPEPWEDLVQRLRGLGTPDGVLTLVVENDLGAHRLSSQWNPRCVDSEADWNPTATWDSSRPRTLTAVTEQFPDARVACLWPTPVHPTVIVASDASSHIHAALATQASVHDPAGADPVWPLAAAAQAGNLSDLAPAWLVMERTSLSQRTTAIDASWIPSTEASGNALLTFSQLSAAQDLDGIRALISAWAAVTRNVAQASLALCAASQRPDGWEVTPLVQGGSPEENHQWAALGQVVGQMRDRAWRRPWPATASAYRILNHLGLMAGLQPLTEARARKFLPVPPNEELAGRAPVQQLLAERSRHLHEIDTLRSKLRWTELMWEKERMKPAAKTTALLRAAKKSATAQVRKRLLQLKRAAH